MKTTMFISTMLFLNLAFAHVFKTKDFCSVTTKDICGHIGYDKKPEKNKTFEFTADIINKSKAKEMSEVVISAVAKKANGEIEFLPTVAVIRADGHHWDSKTTSVSKNNITGARISYKYKGITEEVLINLN